LPVPTDAGLETIGDQVALSDAVAQWEAAHRPAGPPPRGGFELPARPRARWRSPIVLKSAAVLVAGLIGVVAGRQLFPSADAQSSDGVLGRPWLAVTDSVVEGLNNSVRRVSDDNQRTELSAADVAALIFRSPRRRTVFVDSISARADSVISIRGRLAANARFELSGDLRLIRRGVGELAVRSLRVNNVDLEPTKVNRVVGRGRARTDESNRLRFDVPLSVTSIAVTDGVIAMARDPYPQGPRTRVVR
jgi:hypothetical protein